MPIFKFPEDRPTNIREEPTVAGFDFSQDDEMLALSDQVQSLYDQIVARNARLQAWADEYGIEDELGKRIQNAYTTAKSVSTEMATRLMLEAMLTGGEGGMSFVDMLKHVDPILLNAQMDDFSDIAKLVHHKTDYLMDHALSMGIDHPVYQRIMRDAVVLDEASLVTYFTNFLRLIERVEHGVPEWDAEAMGEKPLPAGLPSMPEGYIEPRYRPAIQQSQQGQWSLLPSTYPGTPGVSGVADTSVDDVFSRLTQGLFD